MENVKLGVQSFLQLQKKLLDEGIFSMSEISKFYFTRQTK